MTTQNISTTATGEISAVVKNHTGKRANHSGGSGGSRSAPSNRRTLSSVIAQLPEKQAQRSRHLLSRLKQELKKLGHNGYVREDSQLAVSFISGRLERAKWNLRSVATEIYRTSRLYEETNFADVSRRVVQEVYRACNSLVCEDDRQVVKRTVVHFMVPALKTVYMSLFSLMDEKQQQHLYPNGMPGQRVMYSTESTPAGDDMEEDDNDNDDPKSLIIDITSSDGDDDEEGQVHDNDEERLDSDSDSDREGANDDTDCFGERVKAVEYCHCSADTLDCDLLARKIAEEADRIAQQV